MDAEVKEITPEELQERINRGDKLQIIDVREPHEWEEGHIPQATLIPLATLPVRLEELDKETPIVMVCRSGARSWNATAYVQQFGYQAENMAGGMLAWNGEVEK
ncbi:rhodanese-like domain-containing protein [Brevibacillus humidisoli]|uniref:rhodanese-like domain-containing protein n=1 Tax=Brevibacillus humidisoli TaxID=2895522 RepID=UPI001E3748DD|nr:rhodanese-like domain-containing protein [Brevibacillus humidisoli]UFJ40907.1 rhodanese-like domain-containing protein [Brevibacillus humidisoli]